ncbi:MAG: hypothetical protein JSR94_09395 [Proteobacteria bacterium]|nr:hypothetical protein [Pseudomonadota bacterium]
MNHNISEDLTVAAEIAARLLGEIRRQRKLREQMSDSFLRTNTATRQAPVNAGGSAGDTHRFVF